MKKRVRIYYVRHGKTQYNRDGIMQGHADSALLEESLPALKETADALRDISFRYCFASPFSRTIATAEIVTQGRCVILPVDGLKEMNFGKYDGTLFADHKNELRLRLLCNAFAGLGGESGPVIRKRIRRTFDSLMDSCSDGDTVLVVGHGTFYRNMYPALFHRSYAVDRLLGKQCRIGNGYIFVFEYSDGKYRILEYPTDGKTYKERKCQRQ